MGWGGGLPCLEQTWRERPFVVCMWEGGREYPSLLAYLHWGGNGHDTTGLVGCRCIETSYMVTLRYICSLCQGWGRRHLLGPPHQKPYLVEESM